MRRFVIIGQRAVSSPAFLLGDIPGTSGRIDVLLRCVRAALLVSHGLRTDTVVYLVLMGGEGGPRTVRIDGATARFVRPDERSLAVLVQKTLAVTTDESAFTTVRPGIALIEGGLERVFDDLGTATLYVLDERGSDVRNESLDTESPVFVVGDHLGFDDGTRALLAAHDARPISVGPVSLHAEDAVTVISNEVDRQRAHVSPARNGD